MIDKLTTSGIVVAFTDLENWVGDDGVYPGHMVSVSAIKDFDEALAEAMAFVRQVQARPEGVVHAIRVLSWKGPAAAVDLDIPPPRPPRDSDICQFVVAWEESEDDVDCGPMGALCFFEPSEFLPDIVQVRRVAVDFCSAMEQDGCRVLYIHGYDGHRWHPLSANGLLPSSPISLPWLP